MVYIQSYIKYDYISDTIDITPSQNHVKHYNSCRIIVGPLFKENFTRNKQKS